MNNQFSKSVVAGIIGTAIMSMIMFVAPMMGFPKMSPPALLSGMLGVSMMIGWVMHFMIGIMFALAYTFFFVPNVKWSNVYLKGAVFGLLAFIFAQIAIAILGKIFPMPEAEGSMVMMMIGSIMGHVIFGIAVAKTVEYPL